MDRAGCQTPSHCIQPGSLVHPSPLSSRTAMWTRAPGYPTGMKDTKALTTVYSTACLTYLTHELPHRVVPLVCLELECRLLVTGTGNDGHMAAPSLQRNTQLVFVHDLQAHSPWSKVIFGI